MRSFLSTEEALAKLKYVSPNTKRFLEEAIESETCNFLNNIDTVIIVKKPELKELGDNVIGLYLSFHYDEIWAYVAKDDEYGIRDWLNLGQYSTTDNFNTVIANAMRNAGTCNYCHKFVGYNDIHQVSFAGKSCTKCLPAARAKDEQPGWYN